MKYRLTFAQLKEEAEKRNLMIERISGRYRYRVTELFVPGGSSVDCRDIKEAWQEIYLWYNAAAGCIRNGGELIACEHTELTDEQKEHLLSLAEEYICNDEIEVDAREERAAQFSRSADGGYWIRAWVWLPDSIQEEGYVKNVKAS
jgi:hypothetical protein